MRRPPMPGRCTIRSAAGRTLRRRVERSGPAKPAFAKPDEKAIYEAITELLETNKISDAAYQD